MQPLGSFANLTFCQDCMLNNAVFLWNAKIFKRFFAYASDNSQFYISMPAPLLFPFLGREERGKIHCNAVAHLRIQRPESKLIFRIQVCVFKYKQATGPSWLF